MFILIRQELYKLFMRKKTYVVLIGFILLTGFLAYGIKGNADSMKQYNTPEFQIENLESNISYLEAEKTNIPQDIKNDEKKIQNYQEDLDTEITNLREEIKNLKSTIGKNMSWRDSLQVQIQNQEELISQNKSSASSGEVAEWNAELDLLNYLQKHDIKTQNEYDFNGFMFINKLVEQLGQVFLVIGVAVFAADIVSGEWTPPTLKLLLTQPISRSKVILSKFIATVTAAVGLIILVEVLSFVVVGLLYGFGDSAYPTLIGMKYQFDTSIFLENGGHPLSLINGSATIIPVWQYTMKLLLTQGLFILATTSSVFMVSTLVKSSMVSMGTSVVSLVAATIIFQIHSLQKIAMFIFTSYSFIGEMITGKLAMYYSNPLFTEMLGVIVLIAWTVICYLIAHISFTKRDLLI